MDNLEEKWPPRRKKGNIPPGVRSAPSYPTVQADRILHRPPPGSPLRILYSGQAVGRARPDSTAHSTPAALAPAGSSQRAATCARVLRPAPHWSRRPSVAVVTVGSRLLSPTRTLPHPARVRTAVAGASGSAPPRKL